MTSPGQREISAKYLDRKISGKYLDRKISRQALFILFILTTMGLPDFPSSSASGLTLNSLGKSRQALFRIIIYGQALFRIKSITPLLYVSLQNEIITMIR
jgi:hypothetical protein